ncbi:MAG TPA: AAA family ATPase [Phycisphaerae bacterium]|nr:AAA family ATPase [Phycisphaerae bacterium]HRW55711.1 AAA family ATPase [Phycisphaerae bacterium]
MRTIAIANQKGGCGKTTVTINLAACLAREGRRTLAIDLDPQSHLALGLAVPEEQIESSVTDMLRTNPEQVDLSRFTWQISSNFDLIPSRTDLSALERESANDGQRERRLQAVLESVRDKYDFIILDTPPTIGFLTETALYAADEVIVPVDTGYFSLHGLSKQMETLRKVRSAWNKPLTMRILANHYDVRTKLAREILAELRKRHGDAMFTTFINFNTKLKESASLGQPITEYDPASSGCRDFVRFARELISLSTPAVTAPPVVVASPAQSQAPAQPQPRTPEEKSLMDRADALAADAEKLLATTQTLVGRPQPVVADGAVATSDGNGQPAATKTADPVRVAQKLDRIYGPQAVSDGVVFVIRANGANRVQIAGDFNDWNPDRTPLMHVDSDTFQIKVPLTPGRYQYRYVVDGHWRNDPDNHNVEMNPYGELNNVVDVAGEPVAV